MDTTDTEFIGSKPPLYKYVHFKTDVNTYASFIAYAVRHGISRGEALGRLLVIAENSGDIPPPKKRRYY